jgi:hypothetical protein
MQGQRFHSGELDASCGKDNLQDDGKMSSAMPSFYNPQ